MIHIQPLDEVPQDHPFRAVYDMGRIMTLDAIVAQLREVSLGQSIYRENYEYLASLVVPPCTHPDDKPLMYQKGSAWNEVIHQSRKMQTADWLDIAANAVALNQARWHVIWLKS